MINYEFKDRNGTLYERVSVGVARKLYKQGHTIILCSSNLRPFSMFNPQVSININNPQVDTADFETIVDRFKWYNCTGRYTGRNVYYYTEKGAYENSIK